MNKWQRRYIKAILNEHLADLTLQARFTECCIQTKSTKMELDELNEEIDALVKAARMLGFSVKEYESNS